MKKMIFLYIGGVLLIFSAVIYSLMQSQVDSTYLYLYDQIGTTDSEKKAKKRRAIWIQPQNENPIVLPVCPTPTVITPQLNSRVRRFFGRSTAGFASNSSSAYRQPIEISNSGSGYSANSVRFSSGSGYSSTRSNLSIAQHYSENTVSGLQQHSSYTEQRSLGINHDVYAQANMSGSAEAVFESSMYASTGRMGASQDDGDDPLNPGTGTDNPDGYSGVPVGDGVWFMVVLAVVYGVVRKRRPHPNPSPK